jgi:hypothetical protein
MIFKALMSLRPGAQFSLNGEDYDQLDWLDQSQTKPTKAEVDAEIERLKAEAVAKAYQQKRANEYPPITDYLDGIVKNDQAQVQAYIDACLAVKAKYPKP